MKKVNASVITIGDEILIGQIIDTNSVFIAQELNKIGIWMNRKVSVGDDKESIFSALSEEEKHSDIILITGGLGPTADDITKPLLCEYFGGKLIVNEEVLAHVKYLFEHVYRRTGPILQTNLKQAEVPDVCKVLLNKAGTAPGMLFEKNGKIFISMPGVPNEMKYLITNEVIPYLLKNVLTETIAHKTLVTFGLGESMLAERIKDFESSLPEHIKLAYLPNYGLVRLRLTGVSSDKEKIQKEIDDLFSILKTQVADIMIADEDVSMETIIGRLLNERKQVLSTAESCTGGYIAHLLTANAKSSSFFTGSVVCYDKRIKVELLDVDADLIEKEGTVNEEVSRQLATGIVKNMNTDYGIAVTGLMGPDKGEETEEVGTVWIAVADKQKVESKRFMFKFDRRRNIETTAINALNMLRLFILSNSR
jgi:nicotinamide-nucleotide amidase